MTDHGGFRPGLRDRCPNCGVVVQFLRQDAVMRKPDGPVIHNGDLGTVTVSQNAEILLEFARCPACNLPIVGALVNDVRLPIFPLVATRVPLHNSIPENLKADFTEAAMISGFSPKASAALSRRCLQSLLVLQGAKKHDLADQLAEIYDSLPSYVQPYVDNVRQLGNISAHAKKSKSTGEIVAVEAGEAEWMLEILEQLFDHYYAKPAESAKRHAQLQAKLQDAGKLKA